MHDNQPAEHRWPDNPTRARFVVHLPVAAEDLQEAVRLARLLAHRVAPVRGAAPGEATVSHIDEQGVHHRVFCDLPLAWRRRCALPAGHDGRCHGAVPLR